MQTARSFSSLFLVIFQVRRCFMPHRGWSAMELPCGWVQVLRGPRPNSVRWPMASGRSSSDIQQQQRHTRSRCGVGGSTVESLQSAMGSHQGPEVDALRSALSKAKQAAQERPLKAQLAHTDALIERSRLRIQKLDQETELLNSALWRQARLREQIAAEPGPAAHPPSDCGDELARLRTKVVQLDASLSASRSVRGSVEAAEAVRTRAATRRVGREDDAVPNDARELNEWIGTKMLELRDANDVGDLESIIHLTSLISQGASRMQTKPWQPSVLSNMVFS